MRTPQGQGDGDPGATRKPDRGGTGRRLLAGALFDRNEVLGIQEATVHLSAHGCDTASRRRFRRSWEYS